MKTQTVVMMILLIILSIVALLSLSGCGTASASPTTSTATTVVAPPDPCAVETGTFDITATGFADPAPTGTVMYKLFPCAKLAYLFLPGLSGVSNAATFTAGPLPAFLIPATIPHQEHALNGFDNAIEQGAIAANFQSGSDTITYSKTGDWSGWTIGTRKGVGLQVVTVFLD